MAIWVATGVQRVPDRLLGHRGRPLHHLAGSDLGDDRGQNKKDDEALITQLATQMDFLFERGSFDERRLLCETVFKRLYLTMTHRVTNSFPKGIH